MESDPVMEAISKCNKAYDSVAKEFRNFVYEYLRKREIYFTETQELNNFIDNCFKYRLGFTDTKPLAKKETLTEIFQELIFGGKLKKSLVKLITKACEEQGLSIRSVIKENVTMSVNYNYDYL